MVEHLPSKCEALSSSPSTDKKKKEREKKKKSIPFLNSSTFPLPPPIRDSKHPGRRGWVGPFCP
jgi:hypothetical protein